MNMPWNWPGSRWWRVGLHTHSPASHDFKLPSDQKNPDWSRWVEATLSADLDAAAIIDHSTAEGITKLQEAAKSLQDPPTLYPSVELSTSDGVHLLLLMDPSCTCQHIEGLLSKVDVPVGQHGQETARSPLSIENILQECVSLNVAEGQSQIARHGGLSAL